MKKARLWCLSALITGILALTGCKKEAIPPTDTTNVQIEQMLQLPTGAAPALQATTAHLRTQLQHHDFSAEFLRLHGQPLWQKAIKKGKTVDSYTLYVPTQLPGQNCIASFFTVRYRNGQFTYRLYPRAAMATGLHGRPAWWVQLWLARMEAKALGKKDIRLQQLSPAALAKARQATGHTKGHFFGMLNPATPQSVATESTGMASGNGFVILGDGDDCCIEIWENPDGDDGNDSGDEFYLHDDCSECEDEQGEIEDELVGGVGGGCPWYNPLCNVITGGGGGNGISPTVNLLANTLHLNTVQTDWLMQNQFYADTLLLWMDQSLNDLDTFTGLPFTTYPAHAIAATQATLAALMGNYLASAFDQPHINAAAASLNPSQAKVTDPAFWMLMRINCAILRFEHPEWSSFKIYWEAFRDVLHFMLDGVGLIPGIGEIADLANGIIYTIEGDGANATLSFAGMVPIAGWWATVGRMAKRTITLANGGKTTLKWVVKAGDIIHFGDRGQLRRVLELPTGDSRIAHHIIPWEKFDDEMVQKAAKAGDAFHMNEVFNGIPLNQAVHSGNHGAYLNRVQQRLNNIPRTLSPEQTRQAINQIIYDIREAIRVNPHTHIDNLIF